MLWKPQIDNVCKILSAVYCGADSLLSVYKTCGDYANSARADTCSQVGKKERKYQLKRNDKRITCRMNFIKVLRVEG